jgi:hypothetical protein
VVVVIGGGIGVGGVLGGAGGLGAAGLGAGGLGAGGLSGLGAGGLGVGTTTPDVPIDVLVTKALTGTLSQPEADQLSKLLQSPEGNDAFTPQQRNDLQTFVQGKDRPPPPANELHGDLTLVKDVESIPERFTADLALVRDKLIDHQSLLRADKATRMFDFMVPYVQAVVQMAATPAQQRAVAAQMIVQAEEAGYKELQRQPDGKNGLQVMTELLKAKTPEEVARLAQEQKFDAPVWPKDPMRQTDPRYPADREPPPMVQNTKMGDPQQQVLRPTPQVMAPVVPPFQRVQQPGESRETRNGTNKRLGPMMLWNALHRLRDAGEEGQDSAAQREAMTQLTIAAALILGLFALIVAVLVLL